jgi:CHAT domain-containing protein
MLLFSRRLWLRAAEVLGAAVSTAEALLDVATLLSARRGAVKPLSELTMSLAYCQIEMGQFDQAFLTAERGRARLLSEALRFDRADGTAVNAPKADALPTLTQQVRQLEAEQYGGMYDSDDYPRHERLRRQLRKLSDDTREKEATLSRTRQIEALSPSEPGHAVVVSTLTIHGGVLFILRHGDSAITEVNLIRIPGLTAQQVTRWLTEDGVLAKSWFGAYEARTENENHHHRWMATIDRFCRRLGDLVVKELARKLKALRVQSVAVVAGGGLQFLPLSACATDNVGHCLLDDFAITFAPSVYVATVCSRRRKQRMAIRGPYFLAAVSKYDDAPDLPYVKTEIEVIGQLLKTPPLLDREVTEKAFSNKARTSSIIHLACHGTGWFSDYMFRFSWAPQPVLRFAKGGLSFRDILGTQLPQTSLVTLSACDSGTIDRRSAWDELEGIPHVFLQAGAACVVSSIWSVNDCSTSFLMHRFYSNLLVERHSPSRALREAQLWLRDATRKHLCDFLEGPVAKGGVHALQAYSELTLGGDPNDRPFSHPVYWAPFFVTGA